jgi:hypothetical protein
MLVQFTIYNTDETGSFYRTVPTRTFALKQDKRVGGKLAKERLCYINVAGKKKVLVIGNSARPRAF